MVSPMVEVWDLPESMADFREFLYECIPGAFDHRRVYIEKAQSFPGMGVAGAFNYGKGYGELLGVLAACKHSTREIAPAVWKKALHVTADKQTARTLARQLFPEARITRADHAEALLIAEWGRRQ